MTEYTYPNISFNSKIIGPTPASPPWRDGYAIVGDFNRGPNTPTKSNQLSILTALYGEDRNSGSIALQQAMLQGASNATVVRVVPGTESSSMSFELAGDNVNIVPRTGYESTVANTQVLDSFNRTTGFKLAIDYIGNAFSPIVNFSKITTEPGVVTHPTFNGRGQMDFAVVAVKSGSGLEPVVYEDTDEVLSVSLHNSGYGDYQILSYTEGNNEYVEQYLEKGFTLKAGESVAAAGDQHAQYHGLTIASEPFTLDANTDLKGVLVKGAFSPGSTVIAAIQSVNGAVLELKEVRTSASLYAPAIGDETTNAKVAFKDATYLINGQAFVSSDTAVTEDTGVWTVTLSKSAGGAASADLPVNIVPTVSAVSYDVGTDVTTVTFKGVLANDTDLTTKVIEAGSKVAFSTDLSKSFEVTTISVPYTAATGVIAVNFAGDLRSYAKIRSYSVVSSGSATSIATNVRVHFPAKTQIVVGYSFRPIDTSASITAVDNSRQYLKLPGSAFDSHFVVSEGSGGVPAEFFYQTGPATLNAAAKLAQEPIGIKHVFGYEGDTKTYLIDGVSWTVPFVKASVTVGGTAVEEEAYPVGTQASFILKDLENAIYGSGSLSAMFSEVTTNLNGMPYKFTATPGFTGSESNRIYWNLIRYVAGPTAEFSVNTDEVITVDAVPDVLQLNPTHYSLYFNGKEYPVTAFDDGANTITIDPGTDLTASFLSLATPGDTLYFVSQTQTKDLMMRLVSTEFFSTANYGEDKNYSFTGGRDSSQYAFRDFYSLEGRPLVRVKALSPGVYGNNIKVTILPDEVTADTAKFYLQVEDTDSSVGIGRSKTETFYLDNSAIDVNNGLYLDTRESHLIRAYFIPAAEFTPTSTVTALDPAIYRELPLRVAPALEVVDSSYGSGYTRVNAQGAATVKDISLLGGVDFIDTNPPGAIQARISGYLSALRQLESVDVSWIGIVGINYGDPDYKEVFDYAKSIADNSGPNTGGFRRVVVQLAPSVSPRQAATLKARINSPRFIQLAGVAQGVSSSGFIYQQAAVVGTYIGLGASRAPHISPASTYGGRTPAGLSYSSILATPSVLDAYTRANTEVFFKDDTVGAYKFLNGLTTSNEPGLRYVSVVHTWDQVRDAIYKTLIPYKSQPSTPQLWARIATACDAVMAQFMRDEWLMRYAPTICDERNNSEADLIKGVVNILIQATPSFPADYLKVTDVLDLRANITLSAQPGRSISDF